MVLGTASCETVSPSNLGRPHMRGGHAGERRHRTNSTHCTALDGSGQLAGGAALAGRSSLTWPSPVPIISGMPGESLHAEVEALRARLQSTVDGQLDEFLTRVES